MLRQGQQLDRILRNSNPLGLLFLAAGICSMFINWICSCQCLHSQFLLNVLNTACSIVNPKTLVQFCAFLNAVLSEFEGAPLRLEVIPVYSIRSKRTAIYCDAASFS